MVICCQLRETFATCRQPGCQLGQEVFPPTLLRSCLPVNDLDLIFVLVERSYLHSAPCTVVKVVLAIRIALGVVWPLRMSVMGRRVLRDLDLLHVVVSKRQGERVDHLARVPDDRRVPRIRRQRSRRSPQADAVSATTAQLNPQTGRAKSHCDLSPAELSFSSSPARCHFKPGSIGLIGC